MPEISEWAPIELVERQVVSVEEGVYRWLEASQRFGELFDAGIVSFSNTRSKRFGVRASAYVGCCLLEDGVPMTVKDKIAGGSTGLLRWALPMSVRDAGVPTAVSAKGPPLEAFTCCFLAHVSRYVGQRRAKEFGEELEISSSSGGRLDVRETLKQQARGRATVLAHRKPVLTADILPNQLVLLGIAAVEAMGEVVSQHSKLRDQVRLLRLYFRDVESQSLERAPISEKLQAFARVLGTRPVTGDLRAALEYARVIALHLGPWPAASDGYLPQSWFLNLERLFQDAVFQVSGEVLAGRPVTIGREHQQPFFDAIADRYLADPDLVVGPTSGVHLVADCKYKECTKAPSHEDVYQLLAHCAAFGSQSGLLIYPGNVCKLQKLGMTRANIHLAWATVRPQYLKDDLSTIFAPALAIGNSH